MQLRSHTSRTVSFRKQKEHRLSLHKRAKDSSRGSNDPAPEQRLRVLIVDRDSMSSDLLAGALGVNKRCEVIAVPSSDLLRVMAARHADLVVIASELNSKSRSGFDLAQAVGREHPDVAVVILVNQSTRDAVLNAFRSGARGVFSREQPVASLLDCVERVGRGCLWAGKQESDILLDAFRSIPAPSLVSEDNSPSLTARELEVVQCAAKGRTNRAIAADLGLSEHTVKNYLFRAFEKLGVSSRVELLFYLTMRGHLVSTTGTETDDTESGTGIKGCQASLEER